MTINTRRWSELNRDERAKLLSRSKFDIADVSDAVASIILDVRERGDTAIKELNHRFDGTSLDTPILVPKYHFEEARTQISQKLKDAIDYSIENVRRFHSHQEPDGIFWKELRRGIMAGERTVPIESVAFYVPRGRGSFPSMLYMMAVPAMIAGVKHMAVASPPDSTGRIDPACLYTAELCGVQKSYAMGGAQAWSALAYGTESVEKVDKCIGPGNKYVAAAKKILSDTLDCGLPAGPSESIILADSSPDAKDIARNLLVEAEHGSDSAALLITNSTELAERVREYLVVFSGALPEPRRTYVNHVLSGYGGILIVETIEEGIDIVNQFATEHLQIRTSKPFETLSLISNAGEILLGDNVPFSVANYSVGTNAILPTGGSARTWSGVSVRDFKKRSSVVYLTSDALNKLRPHSSLLAEYEGFPAHQRALDEWEPTEKNR
ncbi:Histidinol dehydrogenase [Olavius algarvensis spirochete endosymbiont]|uniref:histidinol dehydrogenase n=1 Tax=Olavius algarvensis spirochete endosymbiont TaxID=260710 RepID=UPI000F21CAC2|nr:histidinol dehydrogenase [Olavius algarvensis spirochete endosymbiont]VDB00736.1 Histidinol dehydrogenase [Olavius algarvensis spirochete endosymbiont]